MRQNEIAQGGDQTEKTKDWALGNPTVRGQGKGEESAKEAEEKKPGKQEIPDADAPWKSGEERHAS